MTSEGGKKRNHPVMACFFFQLAFSVSLSILLSPSPLSTQLSTLPGATGSIWKCKLQARWSCCFFFLKDVEGKQLLRMGRVGGRKESDDKQLKLRGCLQSQQLVSIATLSDIQIHPRKKIQQTEVDLCCYIHTHCEAQIKVCIEESIHLQL